MRNDPQRVEVNVTGGELQVRIVGANEWICRPLPAPELRVEGAVLQWRLANQEPADTWKDLINLGSL